MTQVCDLKLHLALGFILVAFLYNLIHGICFISDFDCAKLNVHLSELLDLVFYDVSFGVAFRVFITIFL